MSNKVNPRFVISTMIIQMIIWAYMLLNHSIFEEWDGVMQYYSGKYLLHTGTYTGWASHFWPPLQPILLALADPLVMGKIIAFVSGIITLGASYHIARQIGSKYPIYTSMSLLSLSIFSKNFSLVENHALETCFYISSISFFLSFISHGKTRSLVYVALLTAFASLTRYTSYSLALSIVIYLLYHHKKYTLSRALSFISLFILCMSPWLYTNYSMHNHPFATWQYLNIGSAVYPGKAVDWWWNTQTNYHGVWQIISDYPLPYLYNLLTNIGISLVIIASVPWFGMHWASCATGYFIYQHYRKKANNSLHPSIKFILLSMAIYIGVAANAFIFVDALLPLNILGLIIMSVVLEKAISRYQTYLYILILFVSSHSIHSIFQNHKYIKDQRTSHQLYDYQKITQVIKKDLSQHHKNSTAITLLSIHPAHAYYLDSKWIMAPLSAMTTLCDVLSYQVSPKVFHYAPKIPVVSTSDTLIIDYIIITHRFKTRWPFVDSNLNIIDQDPCKDHTRTLYKNQKVHVLKHIPVTGF